MMDEMVEDTGTNEDGFLENEGHFPVSHSQSSPWIETPAPDDDVIRIKRVHLYMMLVPVAFVVGLASGFLMWGRSTGPVATNPPVESDPVTSLTRFDIPIDDDPYLGPADAPIQIVEFSDFNCPYCQRWHHEVFSTLMASYPDQIQFVYRDFPILTQESFNAAQASECADEQGAFWEYHDALFSGVYDLNHSGYEAYALELGLDAASLIECIETGRYEEEVSQDAQFASSLGITGTPTFFINGIALVGAQPLEQFVRIIDEELQSN
jgi:predicted DsbA family dithiol-disulfide isomerase